MTWGVATIRDKFPNVENLSTFKGVALSVVCQDIALALGTDVEVVQTRLYKGDVSRRPDLSKYEGIVILEHPFNSGGRTGFTRCPEFREFNQIKAISEFDGPFLSWNFRDDKWVRSVIRNLVRRCSQPDSNIELCEGDLLPCMTSHSCDADVAEAKANRNHHIYGDSHAYSFWQPNYSVYGFQGKTLYRSLRDQLCNLIIGEPDVISFSFGNTDLRHHFARRPDPCKSAVDLAEEYARQASALNADVTLYGLIPNIEDDTKFFKSYQHKDEFHSGSLELRDEIRDQFNDVLLKSGLHVLMPPVALHNEQRHLRNGLNEVRGPHLKPKAMPWSFATNEPNTELTWV